MRAESDRVVEEKLRIDLPVQSNIPFVLLEKAQKFSTRSVGIMTNVTRWAIFF